MALSPVALEAGIAFLSNWSRAVLDGCVLDITIRSFPVAGSPLDGIA
jgi:hypothetical protein